MKKRKYWIWIVVALLVWTFGDCREGAMPRSLLQGMALDVASVNVYGAPLSRNEGETKVTAHINPASGESESMPEGDKETKDTSDGQREESGKTGKSLATGDLLYEQIIWLFVVVILFSIVLVLISLRGKIDVP